MPDLTKLNKPIKLGVQAKQKLMDIANQYIDTPLKNAGHEQIGAALNKAIDIAGDLIIPQDMSDLALAFIPGGSIAKGAGKGLVRIVKGVGAEAGEKAFKTVAEKKLLQGAARDAEIASKASKVDIIKAAADEDRLKAMEKASKGTTLEYSKKAGTNAYPEIALKDADKKLISKVKQPTHKPKVEDVLEFEDDIPPATEMNILKQMSEKLKR